MDDLPRQDADLPQRALYEVAAAGKVLVAVRFLCVCGSRLVEEDVRKRAKVSKHRLATAGGVFSYERCTDPILPNI